MTILATLFK